MNQTDMSMDQSTPKKSWMRFGYAKPIPVLSQETGDPTGTSVVFLRALRSDAILYEAHEAILDKDAEIPECIMECHERLRKYMETMLGDETQVSPCSSNDAFRGAHGWIEAA